MYPVLNKRIVIFLCIILMLTMSSCQQNLQSQEDSSTQNISENISSEESPSSQFVSSEESTSSNSNKEDWNLVLVNIWNKLPDDFKVELDKIGVRKMDSRIIETTKKMISDAKNDGVDLLLASSYRTVERQTQLFNEQIQKYKNLGYSDDDAYNNAKEWVAVPGTSEHHTGLALDIVTPTYQNLDYGFDTTDAFKWLYENCVDYGFILRYPKNKSEITGITYEPWHYRYVGVDAAKYIMENDLCLEEYLKELS